MNLEPQAGPAAALDRVDVERVRRDFPILQQRIRDRPLVYLDNAATTQKPLTVIYALQRYYTAENANIHRGVHFLSQQGTFAYERSRARLRQFINAGDNREIIFVRGTTEAINLVAQSWGRRFLRPGDEIVLSHLEHHANIVPWQMIATEREARIRVVPIDDQGGFRFDEYEKLLSERTRLVAVTHASNALGTLLPVKEITAAAHRWGARVLIDGAQSVPHLAVDVRDLDCDFYAFSGHKVFGPTGVGVLYGKEAVLEEMPPYQTGGEMIRSVSFDRTTFNELPHKFEAGTPHIAGGIAMEAAVDYVNALGRARIEAYEAQLLAYGTEVLTAVPGLRLLGTATPKVGVLSFTLDAAHPHDIGTILDTEGIAIRTGHHCAQPVMQRFGVPATARASLAFYNTREELDALASALRKVNEVFR
jgi:cysteine desulfurase/selenocysteine lyase